MAQFNKVNCSRGAPMGRSESAHYEEIPRTIRLFAVNLDSGGYDDGGAYWGCSQRGERLYCATQVDSDYRQFVRAADRDSAADALEIPDSLLTQPRRTYGGKLFAYIRHTGMESARFNLDDAKPAPEFLPNDQTPERDIFDFRAMRKLAHLSGLSVGIGYRDPDECFRELARGARRYGRLVTLDECGEFQAAPRKTAPQTGAPFLEHGVWQARGFDRDGKHFNRAFRSKRAAEKFIRAMANDPDSAAHY